MQNAAATIRWGGTKIDSADMTTPSVEWLQGIDELFSLFSPFREFIVATSNDLLRHKIKLISSLSVLYENIKSGCKWLAYVVRQETAGATAAWIKRNFECASVCGHDATSASPYVGEWGAPVFNIETDVFLSPSHPATTQWRTCV